MKKIILFIILVCLSIYGFSINPIDPSSKAGEPVKTITVQSPVTTDECSDLYSVVPVKVVVTIADCPDYDCSVPGPGCTIQLCIYTSSSCIGLPLACTAFDPDNCTYYIDVRANEHQFFHN